MWHHTNAKNFSIGPEHVIQNRDHFHINKDMVLVVILGYGRTVSKHQNFPRNPVVS